MIPALTNLSIESTLSLDTADFDLSLMLPPIIMPSLRILRITQDYNIIGILDAPLLETLVLHDVALIALYTGQDIHKITPFKNLDTIALLDCRFGPRDIDIESSHFNPLDLPDIILYKLACCAKHLIVSSSNEPSLLESGSNLLHLDEHDWPRLQCITLDLSEFDDLMVYLKPIGSSPRSLTLRVVEPLLEYWKEEEPDALTSLEKVCMLETMEEGDLLMDEYWPAPGGIFQEDGNVEKRIDWDKTIRVRGLLDG
ncbi:hypothetical protein M413DRAFT_246889 [Hebeloma cylindrosporum]|uniref:F-box domain-containing protein n=1 Tax=Hebeloma cylindrosporum TaxID=76867 RepID=A0A0C3BNC7_HEBCY|nr:hypothetical protein M413DRAFT_246889 [Hebeloma cylindrosporum h7]